MESQHGSAGSSAVTKIPPGRGADGGGGCGGSVWSSAPSAQFCCDSKTALKSKDYWGNKGMLGSAVSGQYSDYTVSSEKWSTLWTTDRPTVLTLVQSLSVKDPCGNKALTSPNPACPLNLDNVTWNQHWIFIGRNGAEGEAPILWPPDVKSQLIRKDPDAGKDWRQKEKEVAEDEMVG